jgi:hypothetical protein
MDEYVVFKKFYEIEQKYNLIYLKINDVYIWQYLRVDIVHQIVGISNNSFVKTNKFQILKKIFSIFKNSLFYNPFFLSSKKELFFLNPRKKFYKGGYIDHILYDFYKNKDVNIIDVDENYRTSYKRYDVITLMMGLYRKFEKVDFSTEEIEKIKQIQKVIYENFNIEIDFFILFEKYIKTFKAFYKVYLSSQWWR